MKSQTNWHGANAGPTRTPDERIKASEVAWVRGWWLFMWGRLDALDDGWTHYGKLRRFGFTRLTVSEARFGIGVVWGKRMYCLYFRRKPEPARIAGVMEHT